MIYLEKSKQNDIILTLNCDSNFTGHTFVLNLSNQQTNKQTNITINDISQYPNRYNEFIIPSGSTNLTLGMYDYTVYGGSTILETGVCDVTGTSTTKTTQINTTKQKIVLIN